MPCGITAPHPLQLCLLHLCTWHATVQIITLLAAESPVQPAQAAGRQHYHCIRFNKLQLANCSCAPLLRLSRLTPHLSPPWPCTGYLPAACPTVIAVTSMDPAAGSASSFSNFLAEPASAAEKGSVMAAPGNAINSTISYAREDRCVEGSMCPHCRVVAGGCRQA